MLFNLDGGIHCSEVYMKEIQTCGLFKNINPNKITPDALLHLLANRHYSDNAM